MRAKGVVSERAFCLLTLLLREGKEKSFLATRVWYSTNTEQNLDDVTKKPAKWLSNPWLVSRRSEDEDEDEESLSPFPLPLSEQRFRK